MYLLFSILGRIVRVTDEVVEYRKWIKRTFPVVIPDNIMLAPSKQTNTDAKNNNSNSNGQPSCRSYASVANCVPSPKHSNNTEVQIVTT